MGRIIIETPQDGHYLYRIHNEETIRKLLSALEQIVEKERDEEEDILGLWTVPEPIKQAAKR
jgi:hypothetical protein